MTKNNLGGEHQFFLLWFFFILKQRKLVFRFLGVTKLSCLE
jgi:hypothetical protein